MLQITVELWNDRICKEAVSGCRILWSQGLKFKYLKTRGNSPLTASHKADLYSLEHVWVCYATLSLCSLMPPSCWQVPLLVPFGVFFCATLDFCNQVTDAGVCAVWSLCTVVSINAEAKRFVTDRGGLIQKITLEKNKTINKQSLGFPFQHFLQQHWSATVFREATPINQQQIVTTESLAPAHLNDDLKLQGAETSEVWVANE